MSTSRLLWVLPRIRVPGCSRAHWAPSPPRSLEASERAAATSYFFSVVFFLIQFQGFHRVVELVVMVRHNCTLSSTTLWLLLALFSESAIGFQRSLPTKWLSTLKGSLLNHNLRQPLAAISSSSGSITFEVGAAETEELQAYYAANTGNGAVMNIADMVDIPELSEMVKRGELETKELEAIWTEVTGDKAIGADAAQFVRVWR